MAISPIGLPSGFSDIDTYFSSEGTSAFFQVSDGANFEHYRFDSNSLANFDISSFTTIDSITTARLSADGSSGLFAFDGDVQELFLVDLGTGSAESIGAPAGNSFQFTFGNNTPALDLSGDGQTVVYTATEGGDLSAYTYTTSGGSVSLETIDQLDSANETNTVSRALNVDGSVYVGEFFENDAADGLVDIGFLEGNPSDPDSISKSATALPGDIGTIDFITVTSASADASHLTVQFASNGFADFNDYVLNRDNGTYVQLPAPDSGTYGQSNFLVSGISNDGSIVVGTIRSFTNGSDTAAVWTAENGLEPLADYLSREGVSGVDSWTLQETSGISADGTKLAGVGQIDGETDAFLVDLSADDGGDDGTGDDGSGGDDGTGDDGTGDDGTGDDGMGDGGSNGGTIIAIGDLEGSEFGDALQSLAAEGSVEEVARLDGIFNQDLSPEEQQQAINELASQLQFPLPAVLANNLAANALNHTASLNSRFDMLHRESYLMDTASRNDYGIGFYVFGTWLDRDFSDASAGVGGDVDSAGAMIVVDYQMSADLYMGLGLGYKEDETELNEGSEIESDNGIGSIYLTARLAEGWYLDLLGQYGYGDAEIERGAGARGDTEGDAFGGEARISYYFRELDGFIVKPYASLAYNYVEVDGYEEEGAFALEVDDYEDDSLQSELGVQVQYVIELDERQWLIPSVGAGWKHEFEDQGESVDARLVSGGAPITLESGDRSENTFVADASITYTMEFGTVYLQYLQNFEDDVNDDQVIRLGYSFRF